MWSTTDAESGQSILEFMFLAPVVIGIALIMMRVNSAIQISIVNQQYARAQATWLAFNSGTYPQTTLRLPNFYPRSSSASNFYNEMILGVSSNAPSAASTDGGDAGNYTPKPMVQDIRRTPSSQQGSSDASIQGENNPQRSQVRVRTTVGMCTQPIFSAGGAVLNYTTGPTPALGTYQLQDRPDMFNGVLCNSPYLSTAGGT